ncbi:hypothetical protein KIH74_26825 [Kineosporia sp. J2-2]|uniref:Cytotoxic translational repressor of toxin-antitoxin stability system n=1 Tax=Kineosporia corallincola TaxID=2835133 RepID=A0ABS5TQN0_9ACTN|nr:hypothetical protein [Kineosporia corallincola]MBT0772586.1 hypothetical protein [Kineosporia corallincola]
MPHMVPIWVAVLLISDQVAQKIISKHGITPDEVRHAIQCKPRLRGRHEQDPPRGPRYYLKVEIRGRRCLAVLYPSPKDRETFALGSVYEVEG